MTVVDKIIQCVKNNYNSTTISTICKQTGLDRNQVLVNIRKTRQLEKPNRREDIINYITPELPENYSDLQYGIKDPENVEECFFLYVCSGNGVNPTQEEFMEYLKIMGRQFVFDWSNRNNYQSMKKKVTKICRECGIIE